MVIWLWISFIIFILAMLALDLGVLNRKAKVIETRQALLWSGFCALLAVAFSVSVYYIYDNQLIVAKTPDGTQTLSAYEASMRFLAAWLLEQSLSLDNVFVIALIFAYFKVPREYQHRTLFWGIIGALLMRGVMIVAGSALIHQFHWVIYIFGAVLLYTAWKMLRADDEGVDPAKNPLVKLARRIYPVTPHFVGEHFFSHIDGKRAITPLFLVLLVIESTDVIFAVDSIPAVFAVVLPYNDPFLVFTSNIFAILNLRSLYFALSGMLAAFKHLKYSLVIVLAFVGVKMLITKFYAIPIAFSLGFICIVLAGGVISSIAHERRNGQRANGGLPEAQTAEDADL